MNDLEVAIEAARAGATVIAEAQGKSVATSFKGDANPVTEVDRAAEGAILAVIRRHRPDDSILAEESGGSGWDGPRVWLVDPLDGTVNFIHHLPHVAVSVALFDRSQPLVGVVIDVHRKEEFYASSGQGAALNSSPIGVSGQGELSQSLIATGFPYDRNLYGREYATTLGEVLVRAQGVRRLGSAALDLAWVACGRYEGYWEQKIAPWDAAAGVLLVTEAGGLITNGAAEAHRLDHSSIVATNKLIHDQLLEALKA